MVCRAPKGVLRRVVLLGQPRNIPWIGVDLHKLVESESFDESWSEDVGNSGTDVGEHDDTQPDVGLWVDKHLNDLIPLPLPSSGTGLIGPQSLVCHLLLGLGQEPSGFDIAVEEEPDDGCTGDGEDTGD